MHRDPRAPRTPGTERRLPELHRRSLPVQCMTDGDNWPCFRGGPFSCSMLPCAGGRVVLVITGCDGSQFFIAHFIVAFAGDADIERLGRRRIPCLGLGWLLARARRLGTLGCAGSRPMFRVLRRCVRALPHAGPLGTCLRRDCQILPVLIALGWAALLLLAWLYGSPIYRLMFGAMNAFSYFLFVFHDVAG